MQNPTQILAKQYDYERYLCSLFAPAPVRPKLWIIISFACEIMRIPAIVSEEMVGLVRLKWWSEQLQTNASSNNPILQHLQLILADAPQLKQLCLELCEAVAENMSYHNLSAVKEVMRIYFAMLAHAANETQATPQYQQMADLCCEIAQMRTKQEGVSIKLHLPKSNKKTIYLRKLQHLIYLWQKTLLKNPNATEINALALKMLFIQIEGFFCHSLLVMPFFNLCLGIISACEA
jgi:phytoene/squalene synthetase